MSLRPLPEEMIHAPHALERPDAGDDAYFVPEPPRARRGLEVVADLVQTSKSTLEEVRVVRLDLGPDVHILVSAGGHGAVVGVV